MGITNTKAVFLRQRKYGIEWTGARYAIDIRTKDYVRKLLKIGEELNVEIDKALAKR